MNNGKLRIVGCLVGLAGVLLSGSALAQDAPAAAAPAAPPEPAPAPAPAPAPTPAPAADANASTSGSAEVGMALPGAAPQAAAVAGNSDHDSVVGRLAVGFLGREGVPIAALGGTNVVDTPVIGIRYWLSDMLGIDAGIGFGLTSGSQETPPGPSTDDPGYKAFLLHGGVPLALASAGHFTFLIVPELNIGFAGASTEVMGVDSSVSAFHLDVGARAGGEVHFGFIDVPQLSLQAGVGLRLDMDSTSAETAGVESSTSNLALRTTTNGNPWAVFTNSVTALYYF